MRQVVVGQNVDPVKVERAREFRKAMTPEEALLWGHLRANRFHGFHFRRQQVISGFIVDFYCHLAGVVIELDGGIHEGREEYDRERDHVLSTQGLRILRIQNRVLRDDLTGTLRQILHFCETDQPQSRNT